MSPDGPHTTNDVGQATIGAACGILDDERRVLLVHHSYGRLNWELPGGGALPHEDPVSAALRELREETGLVLSSPRLTGVYFETGQESGPALHFVFRLPWFAGPMAAPISPEIADVGFWPIDRLPRPISDFTCTRIMDALGATAVIRTIGTRVWLEP